MFYSDSILTRKGPLANIWLAAHWDRRLTKTQIVQTNIEHSVRDIVGGLLPPMALRLSGQLLLGVSKIYGRKARYLLEDCVEALSRLKLSFKHDNVDMPAHAAKASHAAITMPTVTNLEDALAPEPELDLEALLRETAEAPSKTQMPAALGVRRLDLNTYEVPRYDMPLPPANEDQLPSELRMLEDIELGRRATLEGIVDTPLRPSIEVGRRAESPRPSLPFSPLRTPSKAALDLDFEQVPLNEDLAYLDEPPMPEVHEEPQGRESLIARFSDPPAPAVVRATRTLRPATGARKPLPLDLETELPSATMQEYVRDAAPILLPRSRMAEQFLLQSLQAFNIATVPLGMPGNLSEQEKDYFMPEQVPLNEDDYLLGPADFAVDGTIPPLPKSPRLLDRMSVEENRVPQVNRPLSAPASPAKSTKSVRSEQRRSDVDVSDVLEDLERWQSSFSSIDKPVSFDSIVASARRRQVADAFLQLLVLHTRGMVTVKQLVPYGTITARATPALFSPTEVPFSL